MADHRFFSSLLIGEYCDLENYSQKYKISSLLKDRYPCIIWNQNESLRGVSTDSVKIALFDATQCGQNINAALNALKNFHEAFFDIPILFFEEEANQFDHNELIKLGCVDIFNCSHLDNTFIDNALTNGVLRHEKYKRAILEKNDRNPGRTTQNIIHSGPLNSLTEGFFHELNNTIAIMNGNAESFFPRFEHESDKEIFNRIIACSQKAAKLTSMIVKLGVYRKSKPEFFSMEKFIGNLCEPIKIVLGEEISFESRIDAPNCQVLFEKSLLTHAILNFIAISRDLLPNGGVLSLELLKNFENKNSFVDLIIKDNGKGIPKELLDNLFQNVTKENEKQFSMAYAKDSLKTHGGALVVDSQPWQGTKISFRLPISENDSIKDNVLKSTKPSKKEIKILLVEDEKEILTLLSAILKKSGFTALGASDAIEALKLSEQMNHKIDLLITDVVMPKMNGFALHKALECLHPGIRAIYISGYSEDLIEKKGFDRISHQFLQKPFSSKDFIKTIESSLI